MFSQKSNRAHGLNLKRNAGIPGQLGWLHLSDQFAHLLIQNQG
jgi:hypothetical protein